MSRFVIFLLHKKLCFTHIFCICWCILHTQFLKLDFKTQYIDLLTSIAIYQCCVMIHCIQSEFICVFNYIGRNYS